MSFLCFVPETPSKLLSFWFFLFSLNCMTDGGEAEEEKNVLKWANEKKYWEKKEKKPKSMWT